MSETKCPICDYPISQCQCKFCGTAHPDREVKTNVVLNNLHLLSKEQINHIINLQKSMQVCYPDRERKEILEKMIKENEKRLSKENKNRRQSHTSVVRNCPCS